MASLTEVVEELKGQNDTLEDVKSALRGMLDIDLQKQKDEASQELIDKEKAIEARRSKAKVSTEPKTFAGGVASGMGLTGLSDIVKNALGGIGAGFSGMLGGVTLGSLLGKALGKLFVVGAGAYLGSKFFSDEVVNKLIPDAIENIKIGDFVLGDFSAEIAGALLLLFGPKMIGKLLPFAFTAIGTQLTTYFAAKKAADFLDADGKTTVDDAAKKGKRKLTKNLVGKIGILGLLGYVGTIVGEEVGKLTGSDELGSAVSAAAQGAALGAMFGPKGAIIGAAIGLAYVAGSMLYDWMAGKREEAAATLKEDLDKQSKEFSDALESGDYEAASESLATNLSRVDFGTVQNEKLAKSQFGLQSAELADAMANAGNFEGAQAERFRAAKLSYQGANTVDEKMAAVQQLQQSHGYDKQQAIQLLDPDYFMNYGDEAFSNAFSALPNIFKDLAARPDNFDNTSMPAPQVVESDPYSKLREKVSSPYMVPFGNSTETGGTTELGNLPELPMTPLGAGNSSSISTIQPNQTIDAEEALVAGNQNSTVIAPVNNSDNRRTIINKGGDSPIHLPGLVSATDNNFLSKRDRLMGLGAKVGNSFP